MNVSYGRNGRLNPDSYEFLPINGKYTPFRESLMDMDNIGIAAKNVLNYARNRLNEIALEQHTPEEVNFLDKAATERQAVAGEFRILFEYTDNDLIYGRQNMAPWKPDIDPSYADPYLGGPR